MASPYALDFSLPFQALRDVTKNRLAEREMGLAEERQDFARELHPLQVKAQQQAIDHTGKMQPLELRGKQLEIDQAREAAQQRRTQRMLAFLDAQGENYEKLPPDQQAKAWTTLRTSKYFDDEDRKIFSDPVHGALWDDPVMGFRMLKALGSKYRDPLEKRQIEAGIKKDEFATKFKDTGPEHTLSHIAEDPASPGGYKATPIAIGPPKTRQFSVTDIDKLSEQGGKFSSIGRFGDAFRDEFAGYKSQGLGDAATWMGRNVPAMPGAATPAATAFWQDYDKYKNVVRNDLFGSALTANEQAAFEKADINPGMDPKIIRANLAMQREIAKAGITRKANALIQAGYDPAPVAAAFGLNLKELGVTTDRTRGAASIPQPSPVGAAAPAADGAAPAPKAAGLPLTKPIEQMNLHDLFALSPQSMTQEQLQRAAKRFDELSKPGQP